MDLSYHLPPTFSRKPSNPILDGYTNHLMKEKLMGAKSSTANAASTETKKNKKISDVVTARDLEDRSRSLVQKTGKSLTCLLGEAMKLNPDRHEMEWCSNLITLWNSYIRCTKNPGHFNFIPVYQFGLGHLPASCRDRRMVAYIRALSRFTVRILTRHTSIHRPSYFPCGNMRGTDKLRLATGFAWIPGKITDMPCPIENCPYNRRSHRVYGHIRIMTNKHVVYDQFEAAQTRAQFFYDNANNSRGLPVVQCISLDYSIMDSDMAYLNCITHDSNLCAILQEEMEELKTTYNSIPLDIWQSCEDLSVVISHPHGMAKTVSVGSHHSFDVTPTRAHAHYYSSATCPGSSGAPVFYVSRREKGAHPMWIPAIHSFHCNILQMNCGFK
ncbi:uncharacterized protein LOC101854608 [Aplysia californica]|uniref:Uncharacterized protein LOC101854608 n=1 Tax=Aplysia californica TaxID=6500 RepID=A0ABM0JA59_APLCA|nr:uncharacterized protein LOC101854608 [Aplysia californica]